MGNEVRVLITATDQASAKLSGVQKTSLALTAGFAAVGAASIKMAADFEKGLDQVGAVSGATKQQMTGLRKEALQIGADTAFSAGQAVDAMEELAAGGRTVAQIMGGEARAATSLAAAGNYDLASSANTIATTMAVWERQQLDTNDVVNRLAGAANTSRFGVEDMAAAIAQGGGAAATAGVSFQDFSTSIAATAASFSSGSDAGTSFKTFVVALSGNSEQAKSAIDELGLSFYDAQGALRPMASIVQELHDKLGPLSQEQQTVALKTIFGNDAFRTAAGLMKMTGDEFTAMSNTMGNTNAADVAKERMSNLSGQVEQLRGSLETAGIALGTKAIPALTELSGVATKAVNAFAELPGSTQNLILLGGAATAALPGLIGLTEKATAQIAKMGLELKSGKLSASAFALGITGIAIGLDVLLNKTTGAGLVDRVFGDVAKMEGGKKALADWNTELLAAGPNADRLALATKQLGDLAEAAGGPTANLKEEVDGLGNVLLGSDGRFFGFATSVSKSVDVTKEMKAEAALLGQEMLSSGASVFQLKSVYDELPPALQKAFEEVTHANAAWEAQADAAAAGGDRIEAYLRSQEKVATETPAAVTAIGEWTKGVGEAEDGTKDFKAAIDALHDSFATTNPTVIALNAQHAKLTEELEDLKDKGDAATAADKARVKTIEGELLPAIDKEIKGYADNQKAMEGMSGAVEKMMGPAGYGALLDVMGKLKVPQEDQVALTGRIADAYGLLTRNDIPAAISAFGEMKKQLSPEVWAPIAEAVGPELSRKIKEGMSGPEKDAAVAAAQQLGIDIADGVAQGLNSAANRIVATGRGLIRGAIEEMKAEAQTQSPSKLTYKIGLDIAAGAEVGILDGIPGAAAAAATFAREIFESYNTEALKHAYDNVPDYVKRLSPAAGGSKSNGGPYVPFDTSWYIGGGQSAMGPSFDDTGKIPVGSYIPGLGYKTATGWEQTQGAAASIDQAYKNGTYGSGLLSGPQVIQLVVDGHTLARVVNDANARAGVA